MRMAISLRLAAISLRIGRILLMSCSARKKSRCEILHCFMLAHTLPRNFPIAASGNFPAPQTPSILLLGFSFQERFGIANRNAEVRTAETLHNRVGHANHSAFAHQQRPARTPRGCLRVVD